MKRKLGPNQTSRTNESFTDQLQTWEREENPASKAAHDAETITSILVTPTMMTVARE